MCETIAAMLFKFGNFHIVAKRVKLLQGQRRTPGECTGEGVQPQAYVKYILEVSLETGRGGNYSV